MSLSLPVGLNIPQGLTQLSGLTVPSGLGNTAGRDAPVLSSLFPSNAVFDLDATIAASYTNGQVWNNLVSAPASGDSQSSFNFNLGASSTASTDDPTFTGVPGTPGAYFLCDGADYFSLAGSVPSFLNLLHQNPGTNHTLIFAGQLSIGAGFRQGLFSTTNTGSASNNGISYDIGFNALFYDQRVLATNVGSSRGGLWADGSDFLWIISYNQATNTLDIRVNNLSVSVGWTFTANTNNQVGPVPAIGANGTGSKVPNGTRIYACAMLNKYINSTEASQIFTFYQSRHGRTYG